MPSLRYQHHLFYCSVPQPETRVLTDLVLDCDARTNKAIEVHGTDRSQVYDWPLLDLVCYE